MLIIKHYLNIEKCLALYLRGCKCNENGVVLNPKIKLKKVNGKLVNE
tara:strand:+ start:318 stop:458 length:141 start_codon:yes stop_codon:yes gene_type:complete